ncbi:hypothetical protein CARUB_v10002962mg [Capsella rubella]|uniref:Bifunctional inhibitor/plant lipid transfer protein/seed storage helical domain-containing protein n=1 Tax=Capsella rubella TaxID=81985 RepID=R0FJQ5_9BRAS|nr:non-specific lipid-transfer protein-like protein At5g64080 [Capsella rubella]EOA22346.1 hypothetical protein CARUB_v10002962mg [Capsella rubella]
MKQSLLLSILLLLISSSSLVTPIHARTKSHHAKSPAPAPGPSGSDCSSVIFSMMDCLTYLSIGSNETMPEKSCCDGIETVLQFNPQCICAGLVSASQMGIALNNSRALATPKTCKLSKSPPHCGIIPSVTTTPSASPVSPSAGATPKTSQTQSAAKSPATSPSSEATPSMTAPSPLTSGTNILSVPSLTVVAIIVSSISYILAFSS